MLDYKSRYRRLLTLMRVTVVMNAFAALIGLGGLLASSSLTLMISACFFVGFGLGFILVFSILFWPLFGKRAER